MARNLTFWRALGKKGILFFLIMGLFMPISVVFANEKGAIGLQSDAAKRKTVELIKAAKKDQWTKAKELADQAKDPLATKILLWLRLMDMGKQDWTSDSFIHFSRFIRDNPDWPGITKMKTAAEGVMPENLSNAEVIGWYDNFSPVTAYGMDRYMSALLIEGKKDQAKKFIINCWSTTVVPREQQKAIYKKYGTYLSGEAHKRRLDLLLLKENYDSAKAVAAVLGNGYPAVAEARIGLIRNAANAPALVAKVPASLQSDPGLLYERLKWRRKKDLDKEAIEILNKQPSSEKIQNLEDWWKERHILIRRVLEKKDYKLAYNLASKHGQKDGPTYAEAEWLAGWLALRYLKNPSDAFSRFSKLYDQVETPLSKSRAAYWSGRAAAAQGKKELSVEWYKKGAKLQTFYYGQLSASALFQQSELPKDKGYIPTKDEETAFNRDQLIQAYNLFYEADQTDTASRFMQAFLSTHDVPQAYHYAAERASKRGDYYDAVKIAKDASRKGLFLTKASYPTVVPWVKSISSVEWALVHALIRQESMFDQNAMSSAGALGLMQLMPGTAKEVAGKLGVGYSKASLTSQPSYNIQLGTSYINRLLSRYDGSYPLAIAAYNAGPRRVDEWIETFGDPRSGQIDFLDWIELIPIYETRNYVQRVMEGVYVYRLRLKGVQQKPSEPIHIAYSIQQ